jgi:small-conductance mechanosensitive channel
MATIDPIGFIHSLPPEILTLASGLIALVLIGLVYKFFSRYIDRAGQRLEIDSHGLNSIRLIVRVITIILATSILFTIYQLPTDLFVGGSALVGAIVGFGSSQTINNVAAGFYVLISRPFRVKDYVKIGDVEGQVEEISINYTKLYTPSFNLMLMPNTQVMSNRVLNCTHEGFIKYSFSVAIPHSELTNDEIEQSCLIPAFNEFLHRHGDVGLRRPEYYFEGSQAFIRTFKIRLFIPKGEAKTLFTYQPELYDIIIDHWDRLKAEKVKKTQQ